MCAPAWAASSLPTTAEPMKEILRTIGCGISWTPPKTGSRIGLDLIRSRLTEADWVGQQRGFFDLDGRLQELSAKGDALERLADLVDFEMFRPALEQAVPRSEGSNGGRPAFDHVLMLKVLLLQSM